MTAHELRDLRHGILITLYRTNCFGRTAEQLHRILQMEVACTAADVNAQLMFLGDKVQSHSADELAPGLSPLWKITPAGMTFCEKEKLV